MDTVNPFSRRHSQKTQPIHFEETQSTHLQGDTVNRHSQPGFQGDTVNGHSQPNFLGDTVNPFLEDTVSGHSQPTFKETQSTHSQENTVKETQSKPQLHQLKNQAEIQEVRTNIS